MHRLRNSKKSRRSRDEVVIDGLVVSGLTELALGALTGWPMAVAVSRPQDLRRLGIRSGARLRQWHLDLIMLRPNLEDHPIYKAGVAGSFISASWGFVGLAGTAWKRWLAHR